MINFENDKNCGWTISFLNRLNIKKLSKNLFCDYLIVGAGFTGLSAARKLSQIENNKKIIIVDAQLAGNGASSRNSGYLVDTTLNDGFTSNKDTEDYKKKVAIYQKGIDAVRKFIKEYQVDCDWNECGKYFASSKLQDQKRIFSFSKLLSSLNFENQIVNENELQNKLGTKFYKIGLYTKGGILLNPGKLARSMVDVLPSNVELFENSKLISWKKNDGKIIFGSTVFLQNLDTNEKIQYKIVGKDEADLKNKLIYFKSPIGKGLIGKSKNDLVEIITPAGVKNFEIIDVKYI